MINEIFNKYDFIKNYFETYFKSQKRFPQSIILESSDTFSSYFFAIELARILNCKEDGAPDCTCLNCKWIKENAHPDIISVTPINFKDDDSKTVISEKQAGNVASIINQTSDNHRFFIFSNAKIEEYDEITENKFKAFLNAGYSLKEENWQPTPLNKKVFQDKSSNALLKSVEEAPDKVTFIFLTDTKDNIISTIVSRSLVFKMNLKPKQKNIDVSSFFEGYPDFNIEYALNSLENLLDLTEDYLGLLNAIQNYFLELIKANVNNPNLISIIEKDIKRVELAKRHLQAKITPKNTFEALFIDLSFEGRKLL